MIVRVLGRIWYRVPSLGLVTSKPTDERTALASSALVHGLRHTYATELASSDVSVYTLMKLLGHESMTTSQRYVTAAGTETRSAAAQNPLYALISHGPDRRVQKK
jgi:integrase